MVTKSGEKYVKIRGKKGAKCLERVNRGRKNRWIIYIFNIFVMISFGRNIIQTYSPIAKFSVTYKLV